MYERTEKNVIDISGRDVNKWKAFYPDAQENIPEHMQDTLGKYVAIKDYVDANHYGNIPNKRLHSGIIMYVNNAPII